MAPELLGVVSDLDDELPGGRDHERARAPPGPDARRPEEPGEDRDEESRRLSSPGLGLAGHVPAGETHGKSLRLDWGRKNEPGLFDPLADRVRNIVSREERVG